MKARHEFRLMECTSLDSPVPILDWLRSESIRLGLHDERSEHSWDRSPPLTYSPFASNRYHHQMVFCDLDLWLQHKCEGWRRLFDNSNLDEEVLAARRKSDPNAKPRIIVRADVSQWHNFSVSWQPQGQEHLWQSHLDGIGFDGSDLAEIFGLPKPLLSEDTKPELSRRSSPPSLQERLAWGLDFKQYASGREGWERPQHELMFVQGFGLLDPTPDRHRRGRPYPGPTYNYDTVHSMLAGAIAAAYRMLIRTLRSKFDVECRFKIALITEPAHTDGGAADRIIGAALVESDRLCATATESDEATVIFRVTSEADLENAWRVIQDEADA